MMVTNVKSILRTHFLKRERHLCCFGVWKKRTSNWSQLDWRWGDKGDECQLDTHGGQPTLGRFLSVADRHFKTTTTLVTQRRKSALVPFLLPEDNFQSLHSSPIPPSKTFTERTKASID